MSEEIRPGREVESTSFGLGDGWQEWLEQMDEDMKPEQPPQIAPVEIGSVGKARLRDFGTVVVKFPDGTKAI